MPVLDQLDGWPVDSVSAAVVVGGEVVARHGDTGRAYRLASVTKLLSAYAVLVAVEEEAVTLDRPAGPPGSTVAHLLAHASGLAFDAVDGDTAAIEAGVGEKRIYSNAGFAVLADEVATATGIGFADYLHEAVCAPLGLGATALSGPAGHGAESSVDDLAVFAAELLAPRLLATSTVSEATSVQFPGLDGFVPGYGRHRPNDWGLGMEIRAEKSPHWTGTSNSPATFGHFGQSGTFLWVDPTIDAACVVLTDRDFGAWAKPLWSEFNDEVVAAIHDR
ncbi:serine hydrolase domain-containing protein [Williamsia herbipolensis]|uniref:serine hydrolase domain-containing protein n=1 Tax=Williamsia herbipolensis TaxID=1603258 RepID=UPI0005F886C8|nr:serine hydrolase domain-containing protein [Williamsia herbipolensis]